MGRVELGVAVGCAVVTTSCAIAAALLGRRARSRWRLGKAVAMVKGFEEDCATPAGRLRQLADGMTVAMCAGLTSDGGSNLKMLPTFLDVLPDGTEDGIYYALHFDATSFKVARVELGSRGPKTFNDKVEQKNIPMQLKIGTIEAFFDFVVLALKEIVEREDKDFKQMFYLGIGLGIEFPFSINQLSSSSGAQRTGITGKDVSRYLEEAIARNGLNMSVVVSADDPVGALAFRHYYDKDTVAAVIIGADTNACYIERSDAIVKCRGLPGISGAMVVNMEWGNFSSSNLPRTTYDIPLTDPSPSRNEQSFSKLISEAYLGEIVRRVLYRIANELSIFGDPSHRLSVQFTLRTSSMLAMHEDNSVDLREVRNLLQEVFHIHGTSLKARMLVVRVCAIVIRRAARLVAAGIVAILKKIGRDGSQGKPRRTVIAFESGLYMRYPIFLIYINEAISDILGEEVAQNIVLQISQTQDGSAIGTAMLAAVCSTPR